MTFKEQLQAQGVIVEPGKLTTTQWVDLSLDAFLSLAKDMGRAWHFDAPDVTKNMKEIIDGEYFFTTFNGVLFKTKIEGE